MKKIFIYLSIFLLVLLLTGCLSSAQKKEKVNIEKEVKKIMINYLKDNYNVSKVYNVEAQYTPNRFINDSQFKKIVTANFKKDGIVYQVLYNYEEKKCYDSLSYIKKVNPILINHVKSILDNSSIYDINKPNYIALRNIYFDYTDYCKYNDVDNNYYNYGFFNNYDEVNTYEEIVNYYKYIISIKIIYNTPNNVIEGNMDAFKELANELQHDIDVEVYNQGVVKEDLYYYANSEKYAYYNSEIKKVGDFIVYWKIKDISSSGIKKAEQSNFKVSLVDNYYYFDKKIELNGNNYYLYSDNILEVEDISDNSDLHYLYLKYNSKLCKSKSTIVYKNNFSGKKDTVTGSISFTAGAHEIKRFAIYCKTK